MTAARSLPLIRPGVDVARLRIIAEIPGRTPDRRRKWRAICSCGALAVVTSKDLARGTSQPCECLRAERLEALKVAERRKDRVRANDRARNANRRLLGLCTICGKAPAGEGFRRCDGCREIKRIKYRGRGR